MTESSYNASHVTGSERQLSDTTQITVNTQNSSYTASVPSTTSPQQRVHPLQANRYPVTQSNGLNQMQTNGMNAGMQIISTNNTMLNQNPGLFGGIQGGQTAVPMDTPNNTSSLHYQINHQINQTPNGNAGMPGGNPHMPTFYPGPQLMGELMLSSSSPGRMQPTANVGSKVLPIMPIMLDLQALASSSPTTNIGPNIDDIIIPNDEQPLPDPCTLGLVNMGNGAIRGQTLSLQRAHSDDNLPLVLNNNESTTISRVGYVNSLNPMNHHSISSQPGLNYAVVSATPLFQNSSSQTNLPFVNNNSSFNYQPTPGFQTNNSMTGYPPNNYPTNNSMIGYPQNNSNTGYPQNNSRTGYPPNNFINGYQGNNMLPVLVQNNSSSFMYPNNGFNQGIQNNYIFPHQTGPVMFDPIKKDNKTADIYVDTRNAGTTIASSANNLRQQFNIVTRNDDQENEQYELLPPQGKQLSKEQITQSDNFLNEVFHVRGWEPELRKVLSEMKCENTRKKAWDTIDNHYSTEQKYNLYMKCKPGKGTKQKLVHASRNKVEKIFNDRGIKCIRDEKLCGPDCLKVHVKRQPDLRLIEEALGYVLNSIDVKEASIPINMKNKYQKKGFTNYMRLQNPEDIKTVIKLFKEKFPGNFKRVEQALGNSPEKQSHPNKKKK